MRLTNYCLNRKKENKRKSLGNPRIEMLLKERLKQEYERKQEEEK
jgi:hypothetical protein